MWRLFQLQKGSWTSSSSRASTRACESSSPSLARPSTVTRLSGTRISSTGRTSRKGFRRHRRLPLKLSPRCCGISGWVERLVDHEMRMKLWCGTLGVRPRGVASLRRACLLKVCANGVVCMMHAFGSGGGAWVHHHFVPQVSHCWMS